MNRPVRILCCSPFADTRWRWVASSPELAGLPLEWEFFYRTPTSFLQRHVRVPDLAMRSACRATVAALRERGADLLVTHDARAAWWCAHYAARAGIKIRHLAHSFNFTKFPRGLKRRLMARAMRHVDRFVVHSRSEVDLYADYFGLDRDRFDVKLWGINPPTVAPAGDDDLPADTYLCAIGGNRRDYPTLMAAMARLPDIPLVAVVRPHNLRALAIPPNVTIRCDLPFDQAMRVLDRARFMVLPLDSGTVPCGHVTLVAAMHLGKAFAVTRSAGIIDYLSAGAGRPTGLTCDPASPAALADVIRTLWNDPALVRRLGDNGRDLATRACSEESMAAHFRSVLEQWNLLPAPQTGPLQLRLRDGATGHV